MNIETRKLTVNITENTAADAARIRELIDKLEQDHSLTRSEWTELIRGRSPETAVHLVERARNVRIHHYGHDMYIRGLKDLQSALLCGDEGFEHGVCQPGKRKKFLCMA